MSKSNTKEKAFSTINIKSFITVMILLVIILIFSGCLSYFIPQGAFERTEDGAIIPNTFVLGSIQGIAFWRVLTAPVRVFASSDAITIIMISIFLLIMSGVFNLMEKTGAAASERSDPLCARMRIRSACAVRRAAGG